jgi:cobalt-zinc-cadmium efflux system membrane fusion protein
VNHPSPIIAVKAPISGTIVEQNVTGGAGVRSLDNSPNLFTIADLSRVWVLCDVYENNLAQVHLGDFADVRLNAYPNKVSRGRVGNISRVLDPATRTAKVRLELDNPGRLMRIGMFATATFRSRTEQWRVVVPSTAVIRLHDKDWVFRRENSRRFLRTEIEAGPARSDGWQEVLSGLALGDKVVVNALQFASAADREKM